MHFRLCCLLSTEEKLCARELVHGTQTEPWTKQSVKTDHVANIPFFNLTVLAVESSFNRTSWPCSITLLSNYRMTRNPTRKETSAWRSVILWLALVALLIGILIAFDFLFCFSCFLPFFREGYCLQTKLVCPFLVKTDEWEKRCIFYFQKGKVQFSVGRNFAWWDKKGLTAYTCKTFLVGYWLIEGVCLEVRMLRNFWKGRHGYSECNRVLQVDKLVSTEMSVSILWFDVRFFSWFRWRSKENIDQNIWTHYDLKFSANLYLIIFIS